MSHADNFVPHAMTLEGEYYICKLRPVYVPEVDFCIDIGGNSFLPDALDRVADEKLAARIDWNSRVPNGAVGGYNFHVKVEK
jgi:hypothetical protein